MDLRRLRTLIPFLRDQGVTEYSETDPETKQVTAFKLDLKAVPGDFGVMPPPPTRERLSPPVGSVEYVRNRFVRN